MRLLLLTLAVWAAVGAPGRAQDLDAQARAVAEQLMCPVCQGRTVADSTSALAGQMRRLIRERLRSGERPEQVIAYFVERYGESILAAPPRQGFGWVAWVVPVLSVLLGGLLLGRRLWVWAATPREPDPDPPARPPAADLTAQVEREVERLERGRI